MIIFRNFKIFYLSSDVSRHFRRDAYRYKKKRRYKKKCNLEIFIRSTVKIYKIYKRSSWSVRRANDRSSREKSWKWRTSKHDYTTTNVKRHQIRHLKRVSTFTYYNTMSRNKKRKPSKATNVSPRKLAFPIHFASCWINDDWVHDSDFHYSQSTLTLKTFARERVYHLSTRRPNFFPNLIVDIIRQRLFILSQNVDY